MRDSITKKTQNYNRLVLLFRRKFRGTYEILATQDLEQLKISCTRVTTL